MKPNMVFIFLLLLVSALLSACGPITVNMPEVGVTLVAEDGAPPPEEPVEPAAPSDGGEPASNPNPSSMMILYIILAFAGMAVLFAFIAAMRRPESTSKEE